MLTNSEYKPNMCNYVGIDASAPEAILNWWAWWKSSCSHHVSQQFISLHYWPTQSKGKQKLWGEKDSGQNALCKTTCELLVKPRDYLYSACAHCFKRMFLNTTLAAELRWLWLLKLCPTTELELQIALKKRMKLLKFFSREPQASAKAVNWYWSTLKEILIPRTIFLSRQCEWE